MKIVVVGIGKIGAMLTAQLSREGHEVVAVDRRAEVLQDVQNKFDVATVAGNGASVEIQQEAGVAGADLLVAVTTSDEVNLLCSMVAHKLGCHSIIARVRNPEYDRQMQLLNDDFGITFSFNPEKTAANEIFHLLQVPSFIKRDSFAGGRADMVELRVSEDSPLAGRKLSQMDELVRCSAIVCAAERDGAAVIPSGDFVLHPNDKLTVAAPSKELLRVAHVFGMKTLRIRRVMLVGGSNLAEYLAQMLLENRVEVKLIECSPERCRYLEEMLPGASVICGNGTDQSVLLEEGIESCDAVVSLTGVDEENFMISLFGNYVGVKKTVTKNNHIEYSDIFRGTGIDTVVSPKLLAVALILRYVRAATNASDAASIDSLYRIFDGKAEALGFTVPASGEYLHVPLEQLHFRENTLIALILRGQQVIIPRGTDCLETADSIIVMTKPDYAIADIRELFVREGMKK